MTLIARELPLAPHPLRLARRLAGEPDLAFLWTACGTGPSYLATRVTAESQELDPEPELARSEDPRGRAPRWIGIVPYESRRQLERPGLGHRPESRAAPHAVDPIWRRYGAVACIDQRVTVVGDDRAAVDELSRLLSCSPETAPEPVSIEWLPGEAPEVHAARVRAALDLIAAGEIYQVNLARRIELRVSGRASDILASLCRDTRPPYAAALRFGGLTVVSTSPELLLRQSGESRLLTSPIKGTRPRGGDAESDARWARELEHDPKERAELNMIIDVERNDLGRVSAIGSVRLQGAPFVASQGLVWHRRANVVGRLRPGVSRRELLLAMLPSGSVTGAPKIRAMEIIARLESERRGLYTGAIGFISHSSELTLAMAIRTLTLRDGVGHYFVGGGIVADSNPALELEETRWKALQLIGRAGNERIVAGKVVP